MIDRNFSGVTINPVTTGLALFLAMTLATSVWHYGSGPIASRRAITAAVFLVTGSLLVASMGLRFADGRRATLIRLIATLVLPVACVILWWLWVVHASVFAITASSVTLLILCAIACTIVLVATVEGKR